MQTKLLSKKGVQILFVLLLLTWQYSSMAASAQAELRVEAIPDNYTYIEAGELINYSVTIENRSSQTLTDVSVVHTLHDEPRHFSSLEPGTAKSFTVSYLVQDDDLLSYRMINTFTAMALDGQNNWTESATDVVLYRAEEGADVTITKIADPKVYEEPGDTITYKIFVYNTGTTKLFDIYVTDPLTTDEWSVTNLSPGDSQGFTAYYKATQADMDLGYILNTAEVTAVDPEGNEVTDSAEEIVYAMSAVSQLTISKTATPKEYEAPGDIIEYHISVVNTGINTIYDIIVTDELTADSWTVTNLSSGDFQGFTAKHMVRQADIDNGQIVNTAEVTGHDIDDYHVHDSDDEIVIAVGRHAEMDFTASMSPTIYSETGEIIDFEVYVSNEGNLTLFDVEVSDSFTGNIWQIGSMSPGSEETLSWDYMIAQSDMDDGSIETTITAESTDPDGVLHSASEQFSASLLRIPGGLTPDTAFDSEFFIDGLQYYPGNSLKVYNRQGTLVYEAAPYQNDWDGTPNRGRVAIDPDGKLPGGTYFYMLHLADDEEPYTGYIYLIKQ